MSYTKVLVTGGTGYIASWCIVELLRRGYQVRATVRSLSREASLRRSLSTLVDAEDRLEFAQADLTADAGWREAVEGCRHVLHIASPLGRENPRDRDALVEPARGGALRVINAAIAAGVERVVMTSAAAAARERGSSEVSTEAVWADSEDPLLDPYRRSKILAERAAWDCIAKSSGSTSLTTILPGAVFGPLLPHCDPGSVRVIGQLLQGRPPLLLDLGFSVVDVRDLAAAHVEALVAPEAPGERFLATGTFVWMADIAEILRNGFGADGAKVPRRMLPNVFARVLSIFMPQLRMFVNDLGQRREADNSKASRTLGLRIRPVEETIVECAKSLPRAPR